MKTRLRIPVAAFVGAILAGAVMAQSPPAANLEHPRIAAPAALTEARAEEIYQAIRGQIRDNYAASGDPVTLAYQSWKRYNKAPYRSENHGARFVNHYGNDKAAAYGEFEKLDPLPAGAIVIKDSFTVTRSGAVMTGPFFMMEKMPAGFASGAGTWRFLMLRADGSMIGMTGGADSRRVEFCAECHKNAGAERDYLFFMPPRARIPATR